MSDPRPEPAAPADVVPALLPLAAVAIGVFADGGYAATPRVAFGVAGLAAAGVALAIRRPVVVRAARDPVVVVLLALAAVGALSALWTLGPVDRTLRWALVTAGYAGVALAAAAVATRRGGAARLAAGLALVAAVAAALGLGSAALADDTFAERIAGVWRPGGPFGYPPALALLQLSALPVFIAGMGHRSRSLAAASAAGIALAGGVLVLSASRAGLSLAVVVVGGAIAWERRDGRRRAAAAAGVAAVSGVALQIVAAATGSTDHAVRLGAVVAAVALAAIGWPACRSRLRPPARAHRRDDVPGSPPGHGRAALLTGGIVAVAVVAGSLAFGADAGRGAGRAAGFLHGRSDTWGAAVSTWADAPLKGAGADAFLAGSARHQNGQTILFAHSLPLELGAELGIAGFVLVLALYAATGRALWRARRTRAAWLLGPAAVAFLVMSLVDWPWHLAGAGAVWALGAGALAGAVPDPDRSRIRDVCR